MSKKLFLAVLPFLALAMASCSRGNGGAGSSSGKTSESSEPASEESSEGSEDSSESSEEDSRAHSEPSTEGVDIKIGDQYITLESITPDVAETYLAAKYHGTGLSVKADDTIAFYKDGVVVATFLDAEDAANKNNTKERPGSSTPAESYTVHNDASADVYLKFNKDETVSFWLTGYEKGGATDTITFNVSVAIPGGWGISHMYDGGAWAFGYVWGGDYETPEFVDVVKVDDDTVTFNLDGAPEKFLVVRADPAKSEKSWEAKWNQTNDITFDSSAESYNATLQ